VLRDIQGTEFIGRVRARDGEGDARSGDLDPLTIAWKVVGNPDVEDERSVPDGHVERAAHPANEAGGDVDRVDVVRDAGGNRRWSKRGDGEHRDGGKPPESPEDAAAAARK
jgi:hypothetical protein